MVERIPMGRMGTAEEVAALDLLARERGVLVLDRRDVRHLRRQGRLLMRQVRVGGPQGVEHGVVEDGVVVTAGGERIEPLDLETLELPEPYELLLPVEPPEVWCAGVTYERSRDARVEESRPRRTCTRWSTTPSGRSCSSRTRRCRRTVGPGAAVGVRADSAWNVPEPEIGLVLGERGAIAGYTIGNDVSSREIEGANPLYLPQAKVYAGACALGPCGARHRRPAHRRSRSSCAITDAAGAERLPRRDLDRAHEARASRSSSAWLVRDNPVPAGSVLLTGTGLVPPDDFTLEPGHIVEIHVPGIGTLVNPVVRRHRPARKERAMTET